MDWSKVIVQKIRDSIFLMYGMDVLKHHQNSVLNQRYSQMMNGYIAFIILMMKFRQNLILKKQLGLSEF